VIATTGLSSLRSLPSATLHHERKGVYFLTIRSGAIRKTIDGLAVRADAWWTRER